jgi:GTPase SAR1 family protein
MKAMVKRIQDLRHLGIEDNSLPLPKICVVGDQSTGKSSLIEGMSEIKVPRSAGCCTRCPLEINLSESESPWNCQVILMKKYIYDGSGKMGKAGIAPTRAKPFGPWIEQDPEEELFATLADQEKVSEALKWAQLATLNPGRSYKEYMPGENFDTDETYTQVKFSPNVVRLDISAPRFPNLSFYDLPGVINVAEVDEERYLVPLVENLVREYIKAKNCIVLLTLPMTDDATNSSAARIVRDVRGARERTLGVLTKPDRIQYGEGYQQWSEILRGEKFALGHKYYVVRNNPNPQVGHAQARDEEAQFFSCEPWISGLSEYSTRFGTRKLQTALSRLLLEQIQACLPGIIEQISERAKAVTAELETLPDPPSANIPYILCQKLNAFSNGLRFHIDGGSPDYPLQKNWSQLASDFQKALLESRPTMRLLVEVENIPPRRPADPRRDTQLHSVNMDHTDCEVLHARPSIKRKGLEADCDVDVKNKKAKAPPVAGPSTFATVHFSRYKGE